MSTHASEPPLPEWFSYDVLLHNRCGRKLSEHPMPHTPAASCPFPALPPREFTTVETAPSPAAAGLPLEDVERVARKIHAKDTHAWACGWPCPVRARVYREMAAAALAEMRPTAAEVEARVQAAANQRPTAAEEAVKRVEVVAELYEKWPARLRSALAPVPPDANGGEER